MRERPAPDVGPLMLPAASDIEREKSRVRSGRRGGLLAAEQESSYYSTLGDQPPPVTKIMPAAAAAAAAAASRKQRVQSARGPASTAVVASGFSGSGSGSGAGSGAGGGIRGKVGGRPASSRSAPPLSRPATARATVGRPGTAKSKTSVTSASSRPGTGRMLPPPSGAAGPGPGRQPRTGGSRAVSPGPIGAAAGGGGGGDVAAAAADHAQGTVMEAEDDAAAAAGNAGLHFGNEMSVADDEPDLDDTEVDRRMALKLVMAHGGGDGGTAQLQGGAAEARHRINFEDRTENVLKVRAGKALRFCAWRAVEGSRVHEDLPSYPLPNGLRGHFYDRGCETIDEVTAPAATPPDRAVTLRGLHQVTLPPAHVLLELSIPSEDSGISQMRPAPRLPRDPEKHTLDVGENPSFFGDIQDHPLRFESTVETVHVNEWSEEKVAERLPWDIDASVFAPRKRESDGLAYYNHAKVENKQFERDWKRAMEKEQFKTFVFKSAVAAAEAEGQPKPRKGKELKEIKAAFARNHSKLARAFTYFSLMGSGNDIFDMQLNEFKTLLDACDIPDDDSERCKLSDLDTIFITANYAPTSKDKGKDGGGGDDVKNNNANSLTRFEFIRVIVRVALAKYGMGASDTWDVSDAVERLFTQNILTSFPPAVTSSLPGPHGEIYRHERLYCEEMDNLYFKHLKTLKALYSRYRLPQAGKIRSTQLPLDGWMQLFRDVELFDGEHFTQRDAKICFMLARMTAVDEMNTRKNETLTFVDFLDALGRAAEIINLPTHKEVTRAGFADILDYQNVALNPMASSEARIPRRESCEFEAVKTRRLNIKVETLLQLIFRKLDFDPSIKNYTFDEARFRKRLAVIDQKLGP